METWRLWIDTGGTFTDCLAVAPSGRLERVKVLSSSALRAVARGVEQAPGGFELRFDAPWTAPPDFARGARLRLLGNGDLGSGDEPLEVLGSGERLLRVSGRPPGALRGDGASFELLFDEEAPVLAARLVTGSPTAADLPPIDMRLATTRGTNALLERRGARTALLISRGFADLLVIGDQRRPDLFAREIEARRPLYAEVVEVAARTDARGEVLVSFDLEGLDGELERIARDFESAAVSLIHSHLRDEEERLIAERLRRHGLRYVSASAELSPLQGFLARAETAVVDAYLAPVIGDYLGKVGAAVGESGLRVMTSAGGLVRADRYRAKDSLLSGPAGGVVGAARSGEGLGYQRLIAFDMGGTSTDVSRYDGDFDYRFEQRVGDARLASPALAIETVAAGGGSICRPEGRQLKVGPESAGASPGPACYGAGGPLTLTDVNLLLGRLDAERFEIPLDRGASERALVAQLRSLEAAGSKLGRGELLRGYLAIADQRMADAVRRISVRRGYDPRDHVLIAFGGAGGQHACAVAELLGVETVVLPADAGLLSAVGLGAARVERFASRQVLRRLGDVGEEVSAWLAELETEARAELAAEGFGEERVEIRRRLAYVRLEGQESSLEVAADDPAGLEAAFLAAYDGRYGYRPRGREVELASLRVVASERGEKATPQEAAAERPVEPRDRRAVGFEDGELEAAVFWLPDLEDGDSFPGPALVFDHHASLTVPARWRVHLRGGAVLAEKVVAEKGREGRR